MTIEEAIHNFIEEGGEAEVTEQNGQRGVIFTGIDSAGEFIPFSDLGYNSEAGFFEKSRSSEWKSDHD